MVEKRALYVLKRCNHYSLSEGERQKKVIINRMIRRIYKRISFWLPAQIVIEIGPLLSIGRKVYNLHGKYRPRGLSYGVQSVTLLEMVTWCGHLVSCC